MKKARQDLIITIDGPSGAGKSTVAKLLALRLGYAYLDTGAMYRGVAYAFMRKGIAEDMERFLRDLAIRFEFGRETKVYLDEEDIGGKIRDPEVSLLASHLSQDGLVRAYLTERQREIGAPGGIVMEGRDTGSVVFPDAQIKFYLDADPGERARRRHLELSAKGADSSMNRVKEEMTKRDRDDSERKISPLTIPAGALRIDTTGIDIEGVLEKLLNHVYSLGV
jgi:cytidylate kinase